MAIYHLEAKIISRGSGRSACAAAAYMSCSKILNDYDDVEHDYEKIMNVLHEEKVSLRDQLHIGKPNNDESRNEPLCKRQDKANVRENKTL